ncbi:MAG: TIGR03564 family F420-dependent LLM class oxidoreductase [Acidimicrobiia bacterium]
MDDLVDEVAFAASAGVARYWLAQVWRFDAMGVIPTLAAGAPALEFGVGVAAIYHRHPMTMATQALTTSLLTGGRFTLGVGMMHKPFIEGAFEIPFDRPVQFMREYLDILQPLLQDGAADVSGSMVSYHGPVDVPGSTACPVVLAALGPRMLRLCGERTDGTITWMTGAATVRNHIVPTITAAAEAAGRPAPRVIVGVPIHITDDVAAAKERAAAMFALYGQMPSYRAMLDREGLAGAEDIVLAGDEARVRGLLAPYLDSGATELIFQIAANDADRQRTREFVATLV